MKNVSGSVEDIEKFAELYLSQADFKNAKAYLESLLENY